MTDAYVVVDRVTRETAKMLEDTDAVVVYDEDEAFVVEPRED